ncbi:hypothetical protein ACLQ9H_08605, partial [Bordetella avium]
CGAPRPAVVAIGGITPANAGLVAAAGADSIAVITGLFEAPDIRAAAQACAAPFPPYRLEPCPETQNSSNAPAAAFLAA